MSKNKEMKETEKIEELNIIKYEVEYEYGENNVTETLSVYLTEEEIESNIGEETDRKDAIMKCIKRYVESWSLKNNINKLVNAEKVENISIEL